MLTDYVYPVLLIIDKGLQRSCMLDLISVLIEHNENMTLKFNNH